VPTDLAKVTASFSSTSSERAAGPESFPYHFLDKWLPLFDFLLNLGAKLIGRRLDRAGARLVHRFDDLRIVKDFWRE
jgi:hypothetical protein